MSPRAFEYPPRKDPVPITDKIALTIPEACALSGLGRTSLYEAFKDGSLIKRKRGARSVILRADLDKFLKKLEAE